MVVNETGIVEQCLNCVHQRLRTPRLVLFYGGLPLSNKALYRIVLIVLILFFHHSQQWTSVGMLGVPGQVFDVSHHRKVRVAGKTGWLRGCCSVIGAASI